MEITADCENNEHPSGSEKLDVADVNTQNMNSISGNTDNQENNQEDIKYFSDISVSSVDTYTPKSLNNSKYLMPIEITNWEPYLLEDKLMISGNIAGSIQTDRVCKQRLSSLIFKDDNGITCCILGPMKEPNDLPDVIRNQFKYIYKIDKNGEKHVKDGIPENWMKLCLIWDRYIYSVNKSAFDWHACFKKFSFQPLIQMNNIGCHVAKLTNNGPKTKIKKKFEKYKSMLEQELLRDSMLAESESDTEIRARRKPKKKKIINNREFLLETETTSLSIQTEQSSLNKRTTCYINNQISTEAEQNVRATNTVYCQTDMTLNNFAENEVNELERNDETLSSNVTILSPTKIYKPINNKFENCAINDQLNKKTKNESNKKIIKAKTILKDLTNKKETNKNNFQTINKSCINPKSNTLRFPSNNFWKPGCNNLDSNVDSSSSLEFYENIVANSTAIGAKTPIKQDTYHKINYICSKTLKMLENRRSSSVNSNIVENLEDIDIALFSQTILKSQDDTQTQSVSTSTLSETGKNVDAPDAEPKELKTIKNNLEKTNNVTPTAEKQSYKLRSPKKYVATNETKGLKRKNEVDSSDESIVVNDVLSKSNSVRFSLRKRKKLNYKELLFNRVSLPENSIIDSKVRRSLSAHLNAKKTKKQFNKDEKLFKKCFVMLVRENLNKKLNQMPKNTTDVVSTSKFTVTNINVEKENVDSKTSKPQNVQNDTVAQKLQTPTEHVFKTPLTIIKKKKPKLNKTLHIPNYMPKIPKDRKKLSLPTNPMEIWNIINSKSKFEKPSPPSPFSVLSSDASSDSSDKKRRKLFSPDNWMQSDGCLKTLSQNQYHSSDSRFSIRFDDTDQNMDSELSDSCVFVSY